MTIAEIAVRLPAALPSIATPEPEVFGAVKSRAGTALNVPALMSVAPRAYANVSLLAAALPRRHCSPV